MKVSSGSTYNAPCCWTSLLLAMAERVLSEYYIIMLLQSRHLHYSLQSPVPKTSVHIVYYRLTLKLFPSSVVSHILIINPQHRNYTKWSPLAFFVSTNKTVQELYTVKLCCTDLDIVGWDNAFSRTIQWSKQPTSNARLLSLRSKSQDSPCTEW